PGRTVPGNRPAHSADHHGASGRIRGYGVAHRGDAARTADQWRREHALHELPVDRRRQAHDHGYLPHRHRLERRTDADAKPCTGRFDKVAGNNLNGSEVRAALRAQNLQVSAGILNQPPAPGHEAYQINVEALGRLSTPEQFGDIVVKSDKQGRVTRVRDIGRVEVGAADYGSTAYMDRSDATALLIYAQPGANSLAVEHEVLSAMKDLKREFPQGV